MAKKNGPFIVKVAGTKQGQFVLQLDKKQTILIAKKFLPQGCELKDELILEFYTKEQIKKRQKNLAQAVLEEILGK